MVSFTEILSNSAKKIEEVLEEQKTINAITANLKKVKMLIAQIYSQAISTDSNNLLADLVVTDLTEFIESLLAGKELEKDIAAIVDIEEIKEEVKEFLGLTGKKVKKGTIKKELAVRLKNGVNSNELIKTYDEIDEILENIGRLDVYGDNESFWMNAKEILSFFVPISSRQKGSLKDVLIPERVVDTYPINYLAE